MGTTLVVASFYILICRDVASFFIYKEVRGGK